MFVNLNSNQAKGLQAENFVFTKEFLALLGVTRLNGGDKFSGAMGSPSAQGKPRS
jgi:hypothetical protein